MNLTGIREKLPAILLAGGVLTGVAGAADTVAERHFNTDLGIRGFLREPFDLPNHGMSMVMGVLLAETFFKKS